MTYASDFDSLFAPDLLLPSQHADTKRTHYRDPERRLFHAVLASALEEAFRPRPAAIGSVRWRRAMDAREWLCDASAGGITSARGICEVLGIDYDALVERINSGALEKGVRISKEGMAAQMRVTATTSRSKKKAA